MNRRKFFANLAGLAIAPTLPVAAATAATGGEADGLVIELSAAEFEQMTHEAALNLIRDFNAKTIHAMEAITEGRMSPCEALDSLTA